MLRRSLARVFLFGILGIATPVFAQQASTRIAPTAPETVSPLDAMALVLRSQGYYISPILQNEISSADIQAVMSAANNQFKVQVVLLDKLPANLTVLSMSQRYASDAARLSGGLAPPFGANTPLIIVIAGNQISARGAGLSPEELEPICERAARVIDGGTYRAGLMQIVSTSAYLTTQRQMRVWQFGGVVSILILLGVIIWAQRASARRNKKRRADELVHSVNEELVA